MSGEMNTASADIAAHGHVVRPSPPTLLPPPNESNFAFIVFHFLPFICSKLARRL
jgi:hypothetical protein